VTHKIICIIIYNTFLYKNYQLIIIIKILFFIFYFNTFLYMIISHWPYFRRYDNFKRNATMRATWVMLCGEAGGDRSEGDLRLAC
jgi:hypothetical protein